MKNKENSYEIGMVGLGVMGRNLLLNMADQGFSVAGYDQDLSKVEALIKEKENRKIGSSTTMKEFVELLQNPKKIMILVPAGAPVDSVIYELQLYLKPGDLIIDGGNSYFKDTEARSLKLKEQNILFLGVGVSGGEKGARLGASFMPGGPKDGYALVKPIFEKVAAKADQKPCTAWMGPRSAGHYVKMVHNGIEYGLMQLIAESYDLMKRGFHLNNDEMHKVFTSWNKGKLKGYLIEITANIFSKKDTKTGHKLIDEIQDIAKQTGTGMWTYQSANELQVPVPTIDVAVSMRDLSTLKEERIESEKLYKRKDKKPFDENQHIFLTNLEKALYASMMITYAQGFSLLAVASKHYNYALDLEIVSDVWKGGCIIRSSILEDISKAFHLKKELPNLMLDAQFSKKIVSELDGFQQLIKEAVECSLPIPGLMASLSYFEAYHSSFQPANLIEAQRDYFGAHTYARIDSPGIFHTNWEEK